MCAGMAPPRAKSKQHRHWNVKHEQCVFLVESRRSCTGAACAGSGRQVLQQAAWFKTVRFANPRRKSTRSQHFVDSCALSANLLVLRAVCACYSTLLGLLAPEQAHSTQTIQVGSGIGRWPSAEPSPPNCQGHDLTFELPLHCQTESLLGRLQQQRVAHCSPEAAPRYCAERPPERLRNCGPGFYTAAAQDVLATAEQLTLLWFWPPGLALLQLWALGEVPPRLMAQRLVEPNCSPGPRSRQPQVAPTLDCRSVEQSGQAWGLGRHARKLIPSRNISRSPSLAGLGLCVCGTAFRKCRCSALQRY
jgi:hypothetical protein